VDFRKPVSVVIQHPVTSEASEAHAQMAMTLNALPHDAWLKTNAIVLWPGEDAGADAASKAMREHRSTFIHTVRNLPPHRFLKLLTQASVLIGNSSAGIREASYLGVPVVNIGTRQQGRERGPNVIDVPHEANAIARAIQQQIAHGRYPRCELYGRGDAGMRIAEVLACL
jgi:UDP-N-acetylglucosamine 2-epimerase